MEVEEVPLTSLLLSELGASATNTCGRATCGCAFYIRRSKIWLLVTREGAYQDTWVEYALYRNGVKYRIDARHRKKGKNQSFPVFVIHSPISLKRHDIVRLREKGKKLLAACTKTVPDREFELSVVDDTKPVKPKSIARLKKVLSYFESITDKSMIRSQFIENFIPIVFSAEEAEKFSAHLDRTVGREVSLVSILIFELAYEKYKFKQGSNAEKNT